MATGRPPRRHNPWSGCRPSYRLMTSFGERPPWYPSDAGIVRLDDKVNLTPWAMSYEVLQCTQRSLYQRSVDYLLKESFQRL